MIKGTTSNGFEFEIDKRVFEDWNFIELMAEADSGNIMAAIKGYMLLLGKDQYERLKKYLTEEDGFISSEKLNDTIVEIMSFTNETKN